MTRKEKIELLKQIAAGTISAEDLLPQSQFLSINTKDFVKYFSDGKEINCERYEAGTKRMAALKITLNL